MSERFKYYFSSQVIKDNKTGQRYYGNKPLAELLNELHEENMMLKGEVAHYKLILLSLEEQSKRLSRIHCLGDKE